MRSGSAHGARSDLAWAGAALLALLLWDSSGADLAVVRWFGDAGGFALRSHWLVEEGLHGGGRWFGRVMVLILAWNVLRPLPLIGDMPRSLRLRWWLVTLLCLAAAAVLKQLSALSCPWNLAEFGGTARYISHWSIAAWRGGDGGPGHCFPSGHASNAFAFLVGYMALRESRPRLARVWLAAVFVIGAAFGLGQTLRGAHYPSHTLWTAWVCWALATGAWHARFARRPLGHTLRHGQQPPNP